jgi:hypothetical protein
LAVDDEEELDRLLAEFGFPPSRNKRELPDDETARLDDDDWSLVGE